MGDIQDDQFVHILWMCGCQMPGNGPSPVMPDDNGRFFLKMLDDADNVIPQMVDRVIIDSFWLVA